MKTFTALAYLLCVFTFARCHVSCKSGYPPIGTFSETFKICEKYQSNSCCTTKRNDEIFEKFKDYIKSNYVKPACASMIKEIFCQECSLYSAHLFFGTDNKEHDFPSICAGYCTKFLQVCHGHAKNIFGKELCNTDIDKEQAYCFPKTDLPDILDKQRKLQNSDSDDCLPVCLKKVLDGVKNVVDAAFPPDGTDRLFLVEQHGIIWELTTTREKLEEPFLDMTGDSFTSENFDERGFLSMIFHPQFSTNGLFYVFYNPSKTAAITCRISEMRVTSSASPMQVDRSYERILLQFTKPQYTHNGGKLLFGKDGYLYITVGDGGGAGDKHGVAGNGQNLKTFLGKILRINVDDYVEGGRAYGIPEDNPFVNDERALPEIYAYGLRNPWRASIDRKTGEILVGDVGQGKIEEVDIIVKGGNYGWRAYEAEECYDAKLCRNLPIKDTVLPAYSYFHKGPSSIIGGYFYRGKQISNLEGIYVFGDYEWIGHGLFLAERSGSKLKKRSICVGAPHVNCPIGSELKMPAKRILAFGEDQDGELYMFMVDSFRMKVDDGTVYKFVKPTE